MSGNYRGILYLIISIALIVLAVKFFIFMLPVIIIAVIGLFIYGKVREMINRKKSNSNKTYSTYETSSKDDYVKTDDDSDATVIDVDYKEIKK